MDYNTVGKPLCSGSYGGLPEELAYQIAKTLDENMMNGPEFSQE